MEERLERESTDVWMGNMKHYASVFGDGKDKAIYQRMAQRNKMSLSCL